MAALSSLLESKKQSFLLKESDLFQGRPVNAKMVPTRNLETIVDIVETALPQTTDSDGTVKGALTYQQVGADAGAQILGSMVGEGLFDKNKALVVWDMNPGTGSLLDGFIEKVKQWNFPAYYFASLPDSTTLDWLEHSKGEKIKAMHLEGRLKIEGYPPMPEEMSPEELATPPHTSKLRKAPSRHFRARRRKNNKRGQSSHGA